MSRVLILDGTTLGSLAAARSLGKKGIKVDCAANSGYNLTSYSKYVDECFVYPDPKANSGGFIDKLESILKQKTYDSVFVSTDDAMRPMAERIDELAKYTDFVYPSGEIIDRLDDKGETIKLAREAGVPTPKTYLPEELDEAELSEYIDYPVLVRPRKSAGSRGIQVVEKASNFEKVYQNVRQDHGLPIIQEYVDKSGYTTACILLDDDSSVKATFSYERTKEYPRSGGPTVVGVSTQDETAIEYAIDLLQEADWTGPAEVEFILDEHGSPRLLEVNPRFWMPINLAIQSGVDFPYLSYQMATGEEVPEVHNYETGVLYRWILPNEILWTADAGLSALSLDTLTAMQHQKQCFGVLSRSDPGPIAGTIIQSLDFLLDPNKREMVTDRDWDTTN